MFFEESKIKQELDQLVDYFNLELKKLNTGRASLDVFDNIRVEAYGMQSPLNAVGNIVIDDAYTVKVKVWDKNVIQNVEKALKDANLGASVAVESDFVRLKFNPITEESRKEKVKELGKLLEERKVAIRQVRQKFIKLVESMSGVSEDDQNSDKEKIQKIIDAYIERVDEIAKKKENDLMSV